MSMFHCLMFGRAVLEGFCVAISRIKATQGGRNRTENAEKDVEKELTHQSGKINDITLHVYGQWSQ